MPTHIKYVLRLQDPHADSLQECPSHLGKLVIDQAFTAWLSKQSRDVRDKGAEVKRCIRDESLQDTVSMCITILEPALRMLRLTDGKEGAMLGKVYGYMLQLDSFYGNTIPNVPERIRRKIHTIFMARWEYFHVSAMTAAYRFEPEFCRRDFSTSEMQEVKQKQVLR